MRLPPQRLFQHAEEGGGLASEWGQPLGGQTQHVYNMYTWHNLKSCGLWKGAPDYYRLIGDAPRLGLRPRGVKV